MIPPEIQEILAACCNDTKKFAQIFFPHVCTLPFSKAIHDVIFKYLDDDSIDRLCILAPRGIGKSTITNLIYPAKELLFKRRDFILTVSDTGSQAVVKSNSLKAELMGNTLIKKIFGDISNRTVGQRGDTFSQDMWVASNGTIMFPRGAGQQLRGALYKAKRPDLIIVDDLENEDSIASETGTAKLNNWFHSALSETLANPNNCNLAPRIVVLGTLIGSNSILTTLKKDPTWKVVTLEICDDNYKSNWQEFMSDAAIEKKVSGYRARGQLDLFFREYRNITVATENRMFTQAEFQEYDELDPTFLSTCEKGHIHNVILADPAKTSVPTSAYSCCIAVGVDLVNNKFYVRDIYNAKVKPDIFNNQILSMAAKWNAVLIAPETTGLDDYFMHPFMTEMRKLGRIFNVIPVKSYKNKLERIALLQPYYKERMVYHRKHHCYPLEEQLLAFPDSEYKDVMDCFAHILTIMQECEKHFYDIGLDTNAHYESEFKRLENEYQYTFSDTIQLSVAGV